LIVSSDFFFLGSNDSTIGTFECPDGKRVLGGAAIGMGNGNGLRVFGSYPSADGRSWVIEASSDAVGGEQFRVQAICASVDE